MAQSDANRRRGQWVEETAEMPYRGEEDAAVDDRGEAAGVRARHQTTLLAIPGVTGVAEGRSRTGDPSLVVYVRDASVRRLVPSTLDGMPVECRVTGEIDAL